MSQASDVGQLSPLIPVPKDAIHAGLFWREDSDPKICFGMRPSEYRGSDLVDGDGELIDTFEELVYGGLGFSTGTHGLDQSVALGDVDRENFVCWHLTHPDAFNDTGHFAIVDELGSVLIDKDDLALTRDAFTDAGHSAGLNYNIFCGGNVSLADGRWLFPGGHDKQGNHGIRKMNIFDPATETWVDRGMPAVKADFLEDPTGTKLTHADALDESNTDPPHPSDMRYQRWYPSAAVLPDQTVLVLSGTDQDSSLGGPTTQFFPPCESVEDSAACSKVRIATPEVYDPQTDRTVALENARKLFNMYPRVLAVQTGDGWHDWKVAVMSEVDETFLDPQTGAPPLSVLGQYDPFTYTGRTLMLDVQAAMADPNRDVEGEDHWELVDTAATAHDSGANAQLWKLDRHGQAISQRLAVFGGDCGRVPTIGGEPAFDCPRDAVEMIDFSDPSPTWQLQDPLVQETTQNNATVLPNGKVLIVGGSLGRGPWDLSNELQLFDPDDGSITPLVETEIARHDHSSIALLPDGRVAIMGGNATDVTGDVNHIEDGLPVAQIYSPSYLFAGERPEVRKAPDRVHYRQRFVVHLEKGSADVSNVALIRFGPVTHNWDWGNRYVQLWFRQQGDKLVVQSPAAPGLAVPGYYMLFVVDDGVPSEAELIRLRAQR